MKFKLEVIGFTIESCKLASAAAVHRIELCDNPADGGTTPSYGFISAARNITDTGLFPIIRPRGGDFLYSEEEFAIMKADISICKKLECDGVVLGMLCANGSVDKQRTARLVELAYPMEVTFHRAFDRTKDPYQAMADIIETGCTRILTSGRKKTAMEGAALIAGLIQAAPDCISIMPGSGVRAENIAQLAAETGAVEFHSSARTFLPGNMHYFNEAMNEELTAVALNTTEIQEMMNILEKI